MRSHAFISYVQQDKATADWILSALERKGMYCWMAPRDIASGLEWGAAIVDAIERASSLVVIFSAATNDSKHVPREVERADQQDIPLVLVRLEDTDPTRTLAYFLSNRQWLDCFTIPKRKWPEEIAGVLHELGRLKRPRRAHIRRSKVSVPAGNPFRQSGAGLPASFSDATRDYEHWLLKYLTLLPQDLELKHQRMTAEFFPFFRSTYYRWIQIFPAICADLAEAPAVLAAGDVSVVTFGTWRDRENRLVWGIHFFDEADLLPYTNDLVRLAASMLIAHQTSGLGNSGRKACDAILDGYLQGLEAGGRPFILEDGNESLKAELLKRTDPVRFWRKIRSMPQSRSPLPKPVRKLIDKALPKPSPDYEVAAHRAGTSSLGRQRFLIRAQWQGGTIAFQVKALMPPASAWRRGDSEAPETFAPELLARAVRSGDPSIVFRGNWMIRRVAPDFERADVMELKRRKERELLYGMGWEVANIHLGTKKAAERIEQDLRSRGEGWLQKSAEAMVKALLRDWEEWKRKTR